ncbi:hypothetical protein OEZ86_008692 [Tetradesmus obliquus]|nr:hypothetical protein OEZ86_008692 [Tetradesmus obliquus]
MEGPVAPSFAELPAAQDVGLTAGMPWASVKSLAAKLPKLKAPGLKCALDLNSKAVVPPELARSKAAKQKPGGVSQKRDSIQYAKK